VCSIHAIGGSGATDFASWRVGGGGGGASSSGTAGASNIGGNGGNGSASSITGTSVTYAGGGGGGTNSAVNPGGAGGGGAGRRETTQGFGAGTPGAVNTGGGGGGAIVGIASNGGSGIVIIRYPAGLNITASAGLSHRTITVGVNKVTEFTGGTGTVSFRQANGGSYELLETVIVPAGGTSAVEFTNLTARYGSTYQHLQIRMTARSTRSAFTSDLLLTQFNGDTAANYSWHHLFGDGSGVSSLAGTSANSIVTYLIANNTVSNVFGGVVMDILDPFEAKNTTARYFTGVNNGSGNFVALTSGLWRNTNTLTSIKLNPQNGDFMQYTKISLYGIRSA
jgi:hypothetical protein